MTRQLVLECSRRSKIFEQAYMGTSLMRKRLSLGPYRRPVLRVLGVVGGWSFSYERGTPVGCSRMFSKVWKVLEGLLQGYLTYKKCTPLGPYRRRMPRVIGGS